jgi:hypothetical protein
VPTSFEILKARAARGLHRGAERPKVDRAVLGFLKSEALHPADFTIRSDRVVRLNPELARRVTKHILRKHRCESKSCHGDDRSGVLSGYCRERNAYTSPIHSITGFNFIGAGSR